jgi:hypothetical protein
MGGEILISDAKHVQLLSTRSGVFQEGEPMKYLFTKRGESETKGNAHSSATRRELFALDRREIFAILFGCLMLLWATIGVHAATAYVNISNRTPSAPYATWATAATNIQDAVDAAAPGDVVLVNDGLYQSGGRVVGNVNNRVAVTKPLTLVSVNGPGTTMILGVQYPAYNNSGGVRCIYLTNGAVLSGFTLINGGSQDYGGGVRCASTNAVVTNCVILNNSAYSSGGGAYSGTLNNCTISGNSSLFHGYSTGAGGGGIHSSVLNNCVLRGNTASYGGGAYYGTLNNCFLSGNPATYQGGGAYGANLNNCTLSDNTAGDRGGGAYGGALNNCIVNGNFATNGANWSSCMMNYCCTVPMPASGTGNFTNAPLFVDQAGGDFHLQASSPCINAGLNAYVQGGTDLDGNPRIQGATVDVGAYEFQSPASVISYEWLQKYSLPMDGSADFADTDLDGMSNWQEWRAGTDPTDGAPLLKVMPAASTSGQVTLAWTSVTNHSYIVERATDLGAVKPFSALQDNVPGQAGTTSFTDTNVPAKAYYRVGVK